MWRYVIFAAGVVTVIALPFISDNYFVRIATFVCMYATLALSWNFIGGFAGYPSFATAAFFGLGAYAGALSQRYGVPMGLAWVPQIPANACRSQSNNGSPPNSPGSTIPFPFGSSTRPTAAKPLCRP